MTTTLTTRASATGTSTLDVRTGLPIAMCSAAAFGLSGSLAGSLLVTGWSPAALVAARVGGAFLALLIPCLLLLRRIGLPTGRTTGRMVAYGVVAVAAAQLCFFSAVQHLSVGVALLLEYLAPVLLIGWHWWRSGDRPTAGKLVGAAMAVAGLILVLDLTGDVQISLVGVAWGLGAALCLCVYFLMSDHSAGGPPALLLATAGTGVGAAVLLFAGLIGIVPLAASAGSATIAAHTVPWWLPIIGLALITAALAYLTGIEAVRRLGSSIASFVALSEVILAVAFAALLLGEIPASIQVVGGVLILAGIAAVQIQPGTFRVLRLRHRVGAAGAGTDHLDSPGARSRRSQRRAGRRELRQGQRSAGRRHLLRRREVAGRDWSVPGPAAPECGRRPVQGAEHVQQLSRLRRRIRDRSRSISTGASCRSSANLGDEPGPVEAGIGSAQLRGAARSAVRDAGRR